MRYAMAIDIFTEVFVYTGLVGLQSVSFDLQRIGKTNGEVGGWCRWVPERLSVAKLVCLSEHQMHSIGINLLTSR